MELHSIVVTYLHQKPRLLSGLEAFRAAKLPLLLEKSVLLDKPTLQLSVPWIPCFHPWNPVKDLSKPKTIVNAATLDPSPLLLLLLSPFNPLLLLEADQEIPGRRNAGDVEEAEADEEEEAGQCPFVSMAPRESTEE